MSPALARRLIESQRPDMTGLAIIPIGEGWDNWSFRVGESWLARLPRRSLSAPLIENEWKWLGELAPRLPLPIPVPVHLGEPEFGYPFRWAIYPFIEGRPASESPPANMNEAARTLGRFLGALHQPAPSDAPGNPFRGAPLSERDETTRRRLAHLATESFPGSELLSRIWDEAVEAPEHIGPAVWLHGDFHPSNLLVEDGSVVAVVDWGDITAGDPAVDLAIGWMLLPPVERAVLAAESRAEPETWVRARGWALSLGLALMLSSVDNPRMEENGRRAVQAVLEDL